jgi:hypothetical protein
LSYSLFNLRALFRLAVFGDLVGVDLWNYKGTNVGSIRQAFDYILPFIADPEKWEYDQITEFTKSQESYPLLLLAKKKFDDKIYSQWIKEIFKDELKPNIENFLQ